MAYHDLPGVPTVVVSAVVWLAVLTLMAWNFVLTAAGSIEWAGPVALTAGAAAVGTLALRLAYRARRADDVAQVEAVIHR